MNLRTIRLTLLITLLAPQFGLQANRVPPYCGRVTIPLRLESTNKQFEVTGSWLLPETDGTLRGEICLRNQTNQRLSRLTVIVNYLEKDGSILFSIPYQANLPDDENDIKNIRPFSELRLNAPVEPGEIVVLDGRNLLSITRAPASAEIVYWFAKFYDDRSSRDAVIGQHGFRTDPLLSETPGNLRLSLPHPAERTETLVKLRINEYGRVLRTEAARAAESILTQGQFQALSQQLAEWRFFPAIENGYATQSDLYLLVVFQPKNPLPIKRCFLDHSDEYVNKFALVTLQPIPDSSNEWIPYYGGFPAAGKLETNVIELTPPAKSVDQ